MARVFGTAMSGRAKQRQELAETPIPLKAALTAVPCRRRRDPSSRAGSGRSATRSRPRPTRRRSVPYHNVRLRATKTLAELLNHVYCSSPSPTTASTAYWIGEAKVDKLLAHGAGELEEHPRKDLIVRRYIHRAPAHTARRRCAPGRRLRIRVMTIRDHQRATC